MRMLLAAGALKLNMMRTPSDDVVGIAVSKRFRHCKGSSNQKFIGPLTFVWGRSLVYIGFRYNIQKLRKKIYLHQI